MNWQSLKTDHYFKEPFEHVLSSTIFDIREYDRLYENQNNFDHDIWQKFKERYKQTYTFVEDITKIDLTKDVIALWFFKERSDQTAGPFIEIGNKQITYNHNTFFLTKHRRLIIKETKRKYIRRPVLQLNMTAKQFEDIIGNLK